MSLAALLRRTDSYHTRTREGQEKLNGSRSSPRLSHEPRLALARDRAIPVPGCSLL
jgi:hypothetical protein